MESTTGKSIFKKQLFKEMLGLLIVVGLLNYFAVKHHLFWSVNEFDSVVHFFGGAATSVFFLWFYFFSGFFNPPKRNLTKFFIISVFGTMFIAVSWEIFELILGEATVGKAEYPFDTSLDLIMGLLGALAACLYGFIKELESKKTSDINETTSHKQI